MLKRISCFIFALVLLFSLASCETKEDYIPGNPNKIAEDFEYEQVEGYIRIKKYIGDKTEVTIPERINGLAVCVIGEDAFTDRASLKSVDIPETVQIIEKGAFKRCYYLEKVTGCEGVVAIEEYAFAYDTELEGFPFGDKLQIVGDYAFVWCESITEINVVSTLDYIGNYAFRDCRKVAEINFADEVVNIGKEAFMATDIKSLVYPYATGAIGEGAFKHCSALESITFDERVTYIADKVFQNNQGLKRVVLPAHVKSMGQIVFGSCFNLEEVVWENPTFSFGEHPFLLVENYTVIGYPESTAYFYVLGCPANRNVKFKDITE